MEDRSHIKATVPTQQLMQDVGSRIF